MLRKLYQKKCCPCCCCRVLLHFISFIHFSCLVSLGAIVPFCLVWQLLLLCHNKNTVHFDHFVFFFILPTSSSSSSSSSLIIQRQVHHRVYRLVSLSAFIVIIIIIAVIVIVIVVQFEGLKSWSPKLPGYKANNESVQIHHCICHRTYITILDSWNLIIVQ